MPVSSAAVDPAEDQGGAHGAELQTKRGVLEIVVLLLLAVIAAAYLTKLPKDFAFADEQEYYSLTAHLVRDHVFGYAAGVPTASRPPGYAWALALPWVLHHGVRTLRAFGLLCGVLCAVLTASLARRWAGAWAGGVAALLVLLSPVELYGAGSLFPQTFTALLFLASLWLHFAWARKGSRFEVVAQAVLWSWLILVNPLMAANLVLFVLFVLLYERRFIGPVAICLVVMLTAGAWSWRNEVTFHRGAMLASNSGYNLALGNSDTAGTNTGVTATDQTDAATTFSMETELHYMDRDKADGNTAKAWIKDHPAKAAELYARKWLNWFGYRLGLASREQSSHTRELLIAASYYPCLLLALATPWLLRGKARVFASFLLLNYLVADAAYSVFFTRIRFRLPFDYLLLIVAALGVMEIERRVRASRLRGRLRTAAVESPR